MRNHHARRLLAAAAALALAPAAASAQVSLSPRGLGMGGADLGLARGAQALFANPANLGLHGNTYWSVAVPQFAAGADFGGLGLGDLKSLMHTRRLTDADRARIMGLIPESGVSSTVDIRVPMLVIQNRRFALGVAYGSVVKQAVGRDIFDLMINGYQDGRTDYSVGNTAGSRASYVDVAAAFGHKLGPVSLGVTGHWLHGRTLVQSRLFEPRYDLEKNDIQAEYREVLAHGGSGYSVDVGAAAEPAKGLVLSAAVANLSSRLTWTQDLDTKSLILDRNSFRASDFQQIWTRLDQSEQRVDPGAVPVTVYETARGLYDGAFLPATLRAGASYTRGATALAASYQGALTTGRLSGQWRRQLGVGAERKVAFTTLRAGFASDLGSARMLTGGITLGPITVGLGRTSGTTAEGAHASGWMGSFGLSTGTTGLMP
ncbi:MAG: hypothetical protein JWM27_4404 [Gemmatimonadetes bacterium]|nr:hypothetical protein [Gemmatimonadota bacterium]